MDQPLIEEDDRKPHPPLEPMQDVVKQEADAEEPAMVD